jgi:hypothetical protein
MPQFVITRSKDPLPSIPPPIDLTKEDSSSSPKSKKSSHIDKESSSSFDIVAIQAKSQVELITPVENIFPQNHHHLYPNQPQQNEHSNDSTEEFEISPMNTTFPNIDKSLQENIKTSFSDDNEREKNIFSVNSSSKKQSSQELNELKLPSPSNMTTEPIQTTPIKKTYTKLQIIQPCSNSRLSEHSSDDSSIYTNLISPVPLKFASSTDSIDVLKPTKTEHILKSNKSHSSAAKSSSPKSSKQDENLNKIDTVI